MGEATGGERPYARVEKVIRSWWREASGRVAALDLALVSAALLATFTAEVVLWFHTVFVLVALATLFLPMHQLRRRIVLWVPLVALIVVRAVAIGAAERSELVEIPLLGAILVIVYIGGSRREQALRELHDAKELLEARAKEEREDLRARLDRVQQLEALGRLSLGIAHDFNNVLTAMLGGAEELVEVLEGRTSQATAMEMLEAAERGRTLMDELVGYARQPDLSLGECDVNAVTLEMEAMLRRLIADDVELELDLESRTALIPVDRGRIGQVLVNLVINASDAIPARGFIRVTTHDAHRVVAGDPPEGTADDFVALTVTDTGVGIASDMMHRVFEPGFSTKAPGHNMGMGMASVRHIVESGGGSIDIQSAPGRGTTVRILFPVGLPSAVPNDARELEPMPPLGTESVLVVEDDAQVRRRVTSILERSGYTVVAAANGDAALAWDSLGKPLDLLITDISMPGIGGPEVARAIRQAHPDTPVLFATGLAGDLGVDGFAKPVAALRKPFSGSELLFAVRALIDASVDGPCADGLPSGSPAGLSSAPLAHEALQPR
jgi:signal transduction histidine kinase